jgi:predicted MPP superfamily phosphohydrolase
MNKLKIQYFSDLHLEFYDLTKLVRLVHWIKPKSNICVLAGDIGYPFKQNYASFLISMNKKFEHSFLILGNHEFYQFKENKDKTISQIIEQTEKIIKDENLTNIHFLNNSHYDLGEYRFIGSTLWSHIYDDRYLSNDYNSVYEFTIEKLNEMHKEHKEYLKNAIEQGKNENKKIIVITHHLPSFLLNHPKYAKYYNFHQCFSSHCDDLINEPVKAWFFGHTHTQIDMKINNIPCIANPIGYPGENKDIDFHKIIEID